MATHDAAPAHAPASSRSTTRGWRGSTQRSIFAWSYAQNLTPLSGITCAHSCGHQWSSVVISGHQWSSVVISGRGTCMCGFGRRGEHMHACRSERAPGMRIAIRHNQRAQSACTISMHSAWHSACTQHTLSIYSAYTQDAISMHSRMHSACPLRAPGIPIPIMPAIVIPAIVMPMRARSMAACTACLS